MKKHIRYKIFFVFITFNFLYACSPSRYVADGDYLLSRVSLNVDSEDASKQEIKKHIRQKPNTRILGVSRFHLGLYNLSGRDGDKKLNKWLRSIGEAPVVYNQFLTDRGVEQMQLYLRNKGFYDATARDTVWYKRKKAYVHYDIISGNPTQIQEFSFQDRHNYVNGELSDSVLLVKELFRDTLNTLIKKDQPLDMDLLDRERERITQMLRRKGYFNFSKKFIQFYVDTTYVENRPDIARLLLNVSDNPADRDVFRKYRIRDINVNFDYDPMSLIGGKKVAYQDTMYNDFNILYRDKLKLRPRVIIETLQFKNGDLYDVQKVIDSYARLQSLNLFKFINIVFSEGKDEYGELYLVCDIQLTPMKRQSYDLFLEGTNNAGNIGVGGNLSYGHRNLFRGAENLTFSVWGALKKEQANNGKIFNTREIGSELKLVTPQFWLPFLRMSDFRRNFAPRTSMSLSFSFEETPYYVRRVASAKYGYLWQLNDKRWRYNFDLIDFNYVLMSDVDTSFIDGLRNEYVKSAYMDHMILSATFSMIYTNQVLKSATSYNYFRWNMETSGNVLWAMDKILSASKKSKGSENYYEVLGTRYAQFVKGDVEYRYSHYINRVNTLVYRLQLGCAYPYGNMKVLPFEEAFYSGGANGIRAWQARTLGPGSYVYPDQYPNSVGDVKLEANVEYRFKLFWILEGALFVDAGNVWNINKYENRKGSTLRADFYKQIAVGTGAGLRLDANFFLLRFDWGVKMRDPGKPEGERFVLIHNGKWLKQTVFNIAIGYPF